MVIFLLCVDDTDPPPPPVGKVMMKKDEEWGSGVKIVIIMNSTFGKYGKNCGGLKSDIFLLHNEYNYVMQNIKKGTMWPGFLRWQRLYTRLTLTLNLSRVYMTVALTLTLTLILTLNPNPKAKP